MPVINTGLLTKDARSEFMDRYRARDDVALYKELCTPIKSTKDQENYRWLGSMPHLRQWGTGRLAQGLRSESYDVANLKYEVSIEVDRDEIDDDQTGQIKIRLAEMGAVAASAKDYDIAQLFINGASTGYNSYDGVSFFNAAHVSGASGSQDNDITGTVVASSAPTTAELAGRLKVAIKTMMAFVDDRGHPMANMDASGLMIVCPYDMYYQFLEVVNASVISATTNVMAGVAQVRANPYLTASSGVTWYLCKTSGVVKPFVFQDRRPMEFNQLGPGSEEEFMREKYIFGAVARYRLTYGYWQYCVRDVITTA